jgi:hypothetical protein
VTMTRGSRRSMLWIPARQTAGRAARLVVWWAAFAGMTMLAFRITASAAAPSDYPVFVAQVPNPNDYVLFANGGWDGNWYVGYNNGWIKKLPAIPKGNYARAYLGAKLGRMKTLPPVGRPPQFDPVPGEIWIALSSTPSWKQNQRLKLTTTEDIPLENSAEYALENTGESQWFWVEVPLESVNFLGDNYVALWSPTPALLSVSSSPVLAAGWGGKDINTWLAKNIKGATPAGPKTALATPLSYFQPALALKLIPAGASHPVQVRVVSWQNGTPDHLRPVITASAEGDSIERVWVEHSRQNRRGDVVVGQWVQVGRSLWKAPYVFSLDQGKLPKGKLMLRVCAVNVWGERGASEAFEIAVSPVVEKR